MKKLNLLYGILFILGFAACSDDNENGVDDTSSLLNRTTFAYSASADDVSVLIFGKSNQQFTYLRTLSSGWVGNKTSTNLELGEYKFLYCIIPGVETEAYSLDNSTKLEDIRIQAKLDQHPQRAGYLLPVEEIWMPEDPSHANTVYNIQGNEVITETLMRAVSQVEVHLKRGEEDGDDVTPRPYDEGSSVMDGIANIELHIDGVGKYVDYLGSHGRGNTFYSATTATDITDDGFAFFQGPFVFPTESATPATVKVTLNPTDTTKDPMSATVPGKLERNKKLVITLWMSAPEEPIISVIDITVDTEDIKLETDGDIGVWE